MKDTPPTQMHVERSNDRHLNTSTMTYHVQKHVPPVTEGTKNFRLHFFKVKFLKPSKTAVFQGELHFFLAIFGTIGKLFVFWETFCNHVTRAGR